MAIYLQGNNGSIQLTAPKGGGGSVDLSNYYTKAQTDAKIQEVVDSIPEVDLSEYAKKEEIPDVSAFLTDVPEEYITETELEGKGYLTEHQSLEGYAKAEDIPDVSGYALKTEIPDVSKFQTAEQVQTIVDNAIASIPIYNGEAEDV